MTREHELKTWPDPFTAILSGTKRHEIRVDDRGYEVGDTLLLKEWVPNRAAFAANDPPHYTGRSLRVVVTYLTPGGSWGLPKNLCVMSIEIVRAASLAEQKETR